MATRVDDLEVNCLPLFSPVCSRCVHWRFQKFATIHTCDAFPDGIPEEIWLGDNDHAQPFPGDHGIRFEPAPAAADQCPNVPD